MALNTGRSTSKATYISHFIYRHNDILVEILLEVDRGEGLLRAGLESAFCADYWGWFVSAGYGIGAFVISSNDKVL